MNKRFAKSAVLLALTAFSTAALAQAQVQAPLETEAPGRVGRVALAQGKVSISGDVGQPATSALVNWPVTTRNLITTEPNGRTEVRIGSTAIRIDGDSSLEVTELDDDSVRLRLHYGSASIRIPSADVLPEFELGTPQGRVRMLKPGRLRVDAERVRDTSVISVFDGEAEVMGAGATLTIRAGRSAELRDDDVRTLQARRDAFDDWALARDRAADGARSARYVSTEMTGYEELDRHGIWQDDVEYGPLWIPSVASGWVPYRDGRWTWIAPWGWTWVDNAPWGYAPFHYGRWVHVKNRWAWAPGHKHHHGHRPIWAPALVGWVGASGWYPLGPHDHFVPRYRLSDERLRRLNNWSQRDRDRDGVPDYRQRGLTVNPHVNFARRDLDRDGIPNRVDPDRDGDGIPNRVDSRPGGIRDRADRDGDGIRNRFDQDRDGDGIPNRVDRDGWGRDRPERGQRPPVLSTHTPPRPPIAAAPLLREPARPHAWERGRDGTRPDRPERFQHEDRGNRFESRRERPQPMAAMPQPAAPAMRPPTAVAPPPPPVRMMAPPPAPAAAPPAAQPARARFERRAETQDTNGPRENLR